MGVTLECKNVATSIGASQVGYFLYRMHLLKVNVGILFTRRGISGGNSEEEDDVTYANYLLDVAFQQDNFLVAVITLEDFSEIIEGKKGFWSVLDTSLKKRRFGSYKVKAREVSSNLPVNTE